LVKLRLTDSLRANLKKPLGEEYLDMDGSAPRRLKDSFERSPPTMIITVGDVVSRRLTLERIKLHVRVVDNMEMRRRIEPFSFGNVRKEFCAKNPAGTIESEAWESVAEAIRAGDSLVTIDGEEDLLALPAILEAPLNSVVVYGQPREGIVVVHVTKTKKAQIRELLKQMVPEDGEFQPLSKSV